jgi:hypothetical protein
MIINNLYGSYFVYENNDLIVFKTEDELGDYIIGYSKFIITNNSNNINYDKLIDIRIYNWVLNNYMDYNYLCFIKDISRNSIINLCKQQKDYIITNEKYFFEKCLEYTKYYKSLNNLFKFQYNEEYYYNMIEKNKLDYDIKKDLGVKFDIIPEIEDNIKYSFLTPNSKIYSNSNFIQKIDRKKHIDLFKKDLNKKHYLIDFSGFEIRSLYFYIYNEKYLKEKFYDVYAERYNTDRKDFKLKFLMWLNGAGKKLLENFYEYFNNDFKDIISLKNKINNNKFTNHFDHTLFYDTDYKKLGNLITSTAYDFLIRYYHNVFNKYNDKIKFVYNLFDEFFIECEKDFDINTLLKSKYFPYKIIEV